MTVQCQTVSPKTTHGSDTLRTQQGRSIYVYTDAYRHAITNNNNNNNNKEAMNLKESGEEHTGGFEGRKGKGNCE